MKRGTLWKKTGLGLLVLMLAGASTAMATPCGTLASPTSCSLVAGGQVNYTVTGLSLVQSNALGGGNLYQAGDIAIDIGSGGGLSMLMTFSKTVPGPTPGLVFFANPGETSVFTLSYTVTIAPAIVGSVAFVDPIIIEFGPAGNFGNGSGAVQKIVNSPAGPGTSCLAIVNVDESDICDLPSGLGSVLDVGDILQVSGNTGNVSISSFHNSFLASFTEEQAPVPGVPEPSTYVLLGLGLAALKLLRRQRC